MGEGGERVGQCGRCQGNVWLGVGLGRDRAMWIRVLEALGHY